MKLKNTVNGVELELIGNDWTLIPTQAPERWVDVTEGCDEFEYTGPTKNHLVLLDRGVTVSRADGYRLRKVQARRFENGQIVGSDYDSAFIVERKVP